jgi:tungstate transport system ATP-binding protein
MSSVPAYSVRELNHFYGGRRVLSITGLEIATGSICALAGPNGSGKTTLLSILALLLHPTSGSVQVSGEESCGRPERHRRRLRRQVTMIHQKPVLFSTSVWNNVAYGLRATGRPDRMVRERVGAALERLGLSRLAAMSARKLSGGEAQRVVLARGLVLETPILLLDEPTSFLDDKFRPLLFDLLRDTNRSRGTTILVATHDARFVSSLADRVVRMEQGSIRAGKSMDLDRGNGA